MKQDGLIEGGNLVSTSDDSKLEPESVIHCVRTSSGQSRKSHRSSTTKTRVSTGPRLSVAKRRSSAFGNKARLSKARSSRGSAQVAKSVLNVKVC